MNGHAHALQDPRARLLECDSKEIYSNDIDEQLTITRARSDPAQNRENISATQKRSANRRSER